MTNMNDLKVLDESTEPVTRARSLPWALLGAVAFGVGYASWSLAASGDAPATEPAEPSTAPARIASEMAPQEPRELQGTAGGVDDAPLAVVKLGAAGEVVETDEPVPAEGSTDVEAGRGNDPGDEAAEYATDGSFYVQVASYREKATAERDAEELSRQGLPAHAFAYGGPSAGWWHAVRLGPFPTRAAAEASRFEMNRGERREAYVLPRSNGKYHVQVASFATAEKAEALAKRYAAEGHSTKISRVRMGSQRWYCVRIGPFDTREEAIGYQALVTDAPGAKSEVIPFPPAPQPLSQ